LSKPQTQTGRVVANFGARLLVQDDNAGLQRCAALKKLGLVVTGDLVDWHHEATGDAKVVSVHKRQSLLERPDRRGQSKAIAANLTRLVVVAAIKPGIETLLIDQYSAAAELAGIPPIIVVNKSDLLNPQERTELLSLLELYHRIGYETALVHTQSVDGIDPLRNKLKGQVSMLVGQSGVGKSSIVNQIFPDLDVRVGALSQATGSGSHTTTVSNWYDLPDSGALIDSPGVRQFSLDHFKQKELAHSFVEIQRTSSLCKFNNCTHLHEPQCAVIKAVNEGVIAQHRYNNYKKLEAS